MAMFSRKTMKNKLFLWCIFNFRFTRGCDYSQFFVCHIPICIYGLAVWDCFVHS